MATYDEVMKALRSAHEAGDTESATRLAKMATDLRSTPKVQSTGGGRNNFGGGLLRGLRDPIYAGAQMLTRGLEYVAPAGSGFETWARKERENVESINREAERDYRENWRQGQPPSIDVGRMVGNYAATLPIAMTMTPAATVGGRVAQGVGIGAGTGALQPVENTDDFAKEKAMQIGLGAGFGAAGAGITEGVARVIKPNTSSSVRSLLDEGVELTPGQIAGGATQRIEDALTSLPIVGDMVGNAQRRSVETFNKAVINRALFPVGKSLPKGVESGREAIDYASRAVSGAYDDLLPKLNLTVDGQFGEKVKGLAQMAADLPPDRAQQFQAILKDRVLSKFIGGQMSGETLKTVEEHLGKLARSYRGAADPDQRMLGNAVEEIQGALRELAERTNPMFAGQLSKINNAFAQLTRVQRAGGSLGAKDGVFSAAQYNNAVRAGDSSARKNAFARGNAKGQDMSGAAMDVLPRTVPDSGTPLRTAVSLGALGGLGAFDPTYAMGAGAAAGLYTKPSQDVLRFLMTARPEQAQAVADLVRRFAPYSAAGATNVAQPKR